MPSFKTADGHEYIVRIDAPKIRDARTELDIDLGQLDFGPIAQRLASDPVLLVDVLWILCREQCKAADVSATKFGESLFGDAIDAASNALIQARADFSPARMRSLILKQQEVSDRIRAKTIEMATERLTNPETEAKIMKAATDKMTEEMDAALMRFESATNLQQSAESSPTD